MKILDRIKLNHNSDSEKDLLLVKQQVKTKSHKCNYYIALLTETDHEPARINSKNVTEIFRAPVKEISYYDFVNKAKFIRVI